MSEMSANGPLFHAPTAHPLHCPELPERLGAAFNFLGGLGLTRSVAFGIGVRDLEFTGKAKTVHVTANMPAGGVAELSQTLQARPTTAGSSIDTLPPQPHLALSKKATGLPYDLYVTLYDGNAPNVARQADAGATTALCLAAADSFNVAVDDQGRIRADSTYLSLSLNKPKARVARPA